MTWVEITGPTVQGVSNTGYLANRGASVVTVTLPAAPAVGDIVEVTGAGSGGWTVATNPGQWIMTSFISFVPMSGQISGLQHQLAGLRYVGNNAWEVRFTGQYPPRLVALPAGYVFNGNLTWSPASDALTYDQAFASCTGTDSPYNPWRLPSERELTDLYVSLGMNATGWVLGKTWSATPGVWVDLFPGTGGKSGIDPVPTDTYLVTCVRP